MRREDVEPLLYRAADRLPEPDLADAAWAEGVATRRRRRRSILVSLLVVLVIAIGAAVGYAAGSGDNAEPVPPTLPPTSPSDYVVPAGQIAGIDYWVSPPPGSERFLDRLRTVLGDRLQLPEQARPLSEQPLDMLAAVVLARRNSRYEPLLLGSDSSWSHADVGLVPINGGSPLSPGAISPDGRTVAFPQPGEVVTVDAATAEILRYQLPVEDIRSVSWIGDAQYILAAGPGAAYRILVGEGEVGEDTVVRIDGAGDPDAVTAPYRLQRGAVMRYMVSGQWTQDSALTLPVRSWVGQTFSTSITAARLFIADDVPEVPSTVAPAQVVAAISTLRTVPSRLLVLGEPMPRPARSPQADRADVRQPGCCSVLGWYDDGTPLFKVPGWVLAWDLYSGRVRRVTELSVDGLALGPGLRP